MKKTLLIFLCVCLTLCCTACAFNVETTPTEATLLPTQTDPTDDYVGKDIPTKIRFESFDELAEAWALQNADEATVQAYLADWLSRTGLVNGLCTREDIVEIFDEIGSWDIPYLDPKSGMVLKELSYYPDKDWNKLDIVYSTNYEVIEENLLRFTIRYSDEEWVSSGEVAGNITLDGKTVTLYRYADDTGRYKLGGEVPGVTPRMSVRYSRKDKTMDEIQEQIAQYVTISPLRDIVAQFQSTKSDNP